LGPDFRSRIKNSARVSVPGCYASGFNSLVYPLIKEGIVPADYPVTCHAVSGYSGGGNKLIAQYETGEALNDAMKSPGFYALGLKHKHLPEMQEISGLEKPPLFTPIVGPYYKGMTVAVPLYINLLPGKNSAAEVCEFLSEYYKGEHFIKVYPFGSDNNLDKGFLRATGCNGTNVMEINVSGSDEHILLTARFDNLGKGASGAAVQCMNIMLGLDETISL
jgi:N-acetyl-gamma-glutamyl-phosphate reductase